MPNQYRDVLRRLVERVDNTELPDGSCIDTREAHALLDRVNWLRPNTCESCGGLLEYEPEQKRTYYDPHIHERVVCVKCGREYDPEDYVENVDAER